MKKNTVLENSVILWVIGAGALLIFVIVATLFLRAPQELKTRAAPYCGDAIVDTGEQCDWGKQNANQDCTDKKKPFCDSECKCVRDDTII